MTPEQALEEAKSGQLRPVYVVVGEERHTQSRVLAALKAAAVGDDLAGMNEESLVAGEASVDQVLGAARTPPMFSKRRLVVVRSLERWESAKGKSADAIDRLAEYIKAPMPSTVLILAADKLDKRRRFMTTAQKAGVLVNCAALSKGELPRWVETAAKERGNKMSRSVAELLAELAGPELSAVADALERSCLFAGAGNEVTEDTVTECVVRVRPTSVWELVGAVGRRDAGAALAALDRVYDPHDRGLRLVGVLAWSTRQLIRFESAARDGARPEEAAKRAGAPPFKARELAEQVKRIPRPELEGFLEALARVDFSLKGGSKRPPRAVLEHAILAMCQGSPGARRGAPGRPGRHTP